MTKTVFFTPIAAEAPFERHEITGKEFVFRIRKLFFALFFTK